MKVDVPAGTYIVAVSGGVDSMALLDLLAKKSGLELVVAHFNHGIRADSGLDEQLIKKAVVAYGLKTEFGRAKLGANASEEQARDARYGFLKRVQAKHKAEAIITAHHQDDMLETALLNLLRGTGRRGLTSIANNPNVIRPLLDYTKPEAIEYAKEHHLKWREDTTNTDEQYLRNYIRINLIPKLTSVQKERLLKQTTDLTVKNKLIDQEIAKISQKVVRNEQIKRTAYINLPSEVADEVLMFYLRKHKVASFDKKTINRLSVAIKTAKPGTAHEVTGGITLKITDSDAYL